MEQVLVLNATYEPLRIVSWQKAITLLFQEKVEVLAAYDREIRGVTLRVRLPSVLRLLRRVRLHRQMGEVPFSRANVYARDRYTCQYCDRRLAAAQLTFDHVRPAARGGSRTWENIVTCCIRCNRRKGDAATPEEAGLRLRRQPRRPPRPAGLTLTLGLRRAPECWRDYLAWDLVLEGR